MRELRTLRRMINLTQLELAQLTGIHPSRISILERGLVDSRPDERERILAAFKIREKRKAAKRRGE